MKLQYRFVLSVIAAFFVTFVVMDGIFVFHTRNAMLSQAKLSMEAEEKAYDTAIDDLRLASYFAIRDAMMEGNMDEFQALLKGQKEVRSLKELSLVDFKGRITHSTDDKKLKTVVPDSLAKELLAKPGMLRRSTEDTLVVYQSMAAADCMECHNEFKDHAVGGVFVFKYSLTSLKEARARWTGFVEEMHDEALLNGGLLLGVMILVLGAVIVWLVRVQISKPLDSINKALSQGAEEMTTASENIAASSRTLAEGSSDQAASTEEASASLEELQSMTKRNAEDASLANEMALAAQASAERGVTAVSTMASTMQEVSGASQRMGTTLKIIDEISFQTNILALNAAVEAARAGEAGAGFAVVAEEVRNLAMRSAEAAKSISEMVTDVQSRIQQGGELAVQVRAQLEDINERARKQAELIAQIARASQEQQQGTAQITASVHQIDQVTQQNTATSEESSALAQQLRAHATELVDDVCKLTTLVHGDGKCFMKSS